MGESTLPQSPASSIENNSTIVVDVPRTIEPQQSQDTDGKPIFKSTTTAQNTTNEEGSLLPVLALSQSVGGTETNEQESSSKIETPPPSKLSNQIHRNGHLSSQIIALETELAIARAALSTPEANETIAQHIRLLHEYNEIRDAGLGLMGMVADRRGVRVGEIMGEFGVGEKD